MVIGPTAAVAVVGGAVAFHDGTTLEADSVTVTVDGGLAVLLPHAATVRATADTTAANPTMFPLTVAERITTDPAR